MREITSGSTATRDRDWLSHQAGDLGAVTIDDMALVRGQGGLDRIRPHVRIAVHVAPDPGTETQEGREGVIAGVLAERLVQGRGQAFVEGRQDAVENVGEIEKHLFQLVVHGGPDRRVLLGLPGGRDRHADAGPGHRLFRRHPRGVQSFQQSPGDDLFFFQEGAPRGLGGMGGEHRRDSRLPEQFQHLVPAHALRGQPAERVLQSVRLRRGRVTLVVAPAADAMDFLRQVDHLEPGRKAPGHLPGEDRVQVAHRIAQ